MKDLTDMKNTIPQLILVENHLPGYGGPETWEFIVHYKRRILDRTSTTSERNVGLLKEQFRQKWEKKTAAGLARSA